MEQDLNRRIIHIHNKKVTVQETNPYTLLPIQPVLQLNAETRAVSNISARIDDLPEVVKVPEIVKVP